MMLGSILAIALLTPAHHPAEPACAVEQKVCVAEPIIKVKETAVYSSRCVEFCLRATSLWPFSHQDCAQCSSVKTKKVLIKRICTEERPGYKCVPAVAPHCETEFKR